MNLRPAMTFPLAAALLAGCAEEPRPAAEEPMPADVEASQVDLSEAEIAALAEKQKVCAVTHEPLGSMGAPEPVAVTDSKGVKHTVLICCESCREELLRSPDEYLAKLEEDNASATE